MDTSKNQEQTNVVPVGKPASSTQGCEFQT